MPTRYWTAAMALVVIAVGATLWYGRTTPQPAPLLLDSGDPTESSITVHVAGAVASPGLVVVPQDARVADVIAAAGGSTRDADLSRVNLAAPLRDGEQIVIPNHTPDVGLESAIAADGRIHINRASASEMESLPGVGPVLANRIVAYRDGNGPFVVVEDLLSVAGIGEAKLAALRDAVAVP
ncbi:MAG: ComEA family DNA-binding protein [Acidimicrobiia bacterium]|nr:ComEA family DNA-binding protein [Acidimicrobiia bacterium]